MAQLTVSPIALVTEVAEGDDLAGLLLEALTDMGMTPQHGDILVVAQKIVSKAEGRFVDLRTVAPSSRALDLARITGKDPRLVELILGESSEVVRAKPNILIVRHKLGFVMANAGIDMSNVPSGPGEERVLLLPEDPDASAAVLQGRFGDRIGVIISDSFGRPWRKGVVNIALGSAGLPALIDRRGEHDRHGRPLQVTEVAIADAAAAAAGLVTGEGAEGCPAALLRGLSWSQPARCARDLLRPLDEDLFR